MNQQNTDCGDPVASNTTPPTPLQPRVAKGVAFITAVSSCVKSEESNAAQARCHIAPISQRNRSTNHNHEHRELS